MVIAQKKLAEIQLPATPISLVSNEVIIEIVE